MVINAIWDVCDNQGNLIIAQNDLEHAPIEHFKSDFRDTEKSRIFSSNEGQRIGREVSLEEIEEILKKFSKSNSPGPDC